MSSVIKFEDENLNYVNAVLSVKLARILGNNIQINYANEVINVTQNDSVDDLSPYLANMLSTYIDKKYEEENYLEYLEKRIQELLAIKESVAKSELQVIDKLSWQEFITSNPKNEFNTLIKLTNRWACLMEAAINQGEEFSSFALRTYYIASFKGLGSLEKLSHNEHINYNMAVYILCNHWIYKDELKKWHNESNGYSCEDDTIIFTHALKKPNPPLFKGLY